MKKRIISVPIFLHVLSQGILLVGLSWHGLSDKVFFSSDTNLRFIQIEQLLENNWQSLAIDYPLREFDSELRYVPYYYAYSVLDGAIFFQISPFFPVVTAYLYALLGTLGLAIIPAMATVLTAVAVYRLAQLANLPYARGALWATAVATPLLFYSLELWDHTLGTALMLWAVYAIAYGLHTQSLWSAVAGGICLGLGLGQRPELYMFAVAVGLALLLCRVGVKMVTAVIVGGLVGAIPIWWAQWVWVGHPLGMAFAPHLLGYGQHAFVPASEGYTAWVKVWYLSFGAQSNGNPTIIQTLLVVYGFIFLSYRLYRGQTVTAVGLLLPSLGLFGGYLLWLWQSSEALLVGLLPTVPLFALACIYPRTPSKEGQSSAIYRFISLTALFFFSLMLVLWPSFGGIQWGSRYLLPLYPLLIWLALYVYASYDKSGDNSFGRMWRWLGLGLLLLSVALQFSSVRLLQQQRRQLEAIQQVVQAIPADIVLTDHLFLPVFTAASTQKQFLYITTSQDIETLVTQFAQAGITEVGIVPGASERFAQPIPLLDIPLTFNGLTLQQTEPYTYQIVVTP